MKPKEVHERLRSLARPCPCCGQPLVFAVEGPRETEPAARELARIIVWLQEHGARLTYASVEDAAAHVMEGTGEMPTETQKRRS